AKHKGLAVGISCLRARKRERGHWVSCSRPRPPGGGAEGCRPAGGAPRAPAPPAVPARRGRAPPPPPRPPPPPAAPTLGWSSPRARAWAQRDRSAAGIVAPLHARSTERPALLGAGRGVCFASSTRLRPPSAPIGGSRRIQNCDGLQRTGAWHVGTTQRY